MAKTGKDVGGNGKYAVAVPDDMERPPSLARRIGPKKTIYLDDEHREYVFRMAAEGRKPALIAAALGITKRMLTYRANQELADGCDIAISEGLVSKIFAQRSAQAMISPEMRYQVRIMASKGLSRDDMTMILGMNESTFKAYLGDEVARGKAMGNEKVATTAFDMATDGEHPTVTTFWLKTQMGWKESTQIEFPDENGNPQKLVGTTVNLSAENMQAVIASLNEHV
jgi:DNA-binding CsgD family transcriptional regulator